MSAQWTLFVVLGFVLNFTCHAENEKTTQMVPLVPSFPVVSYQKKKGEGAEDEVPLSVVAALSKTQEARLMKKLMREALEWAYDPRTIALERGGRQKLVTQIADNQIFFEPENSSREVQFEQLDFSGIKRTDYDLLRRWFHSITALRHRSDALNANQGGAALSKVLYDGYNAEFLRVVDRSHKQDERMRREIGIGTAEILAGLTSEGRTLRRLATDVEKALGESVGSRAWFENEEWIKRILADSKSVFWETGAAAWTGNVSDKAPSLSQKLELIQEKNFSKDETKRLTDFVTASEAYKAKVHYYRAVPMSNTKVVLTTIASAAKDLGARCWAALTRAGG